MRRVVTSWSQRRVHISGKTGAVALMLRTPHLPDFSLIPI